MVKKIWPFEFIFGVEHPQNKNSKGKNLQHEVKKYAINQLQNREQFISLLIIIMIITYFCP